MKIGYFITRYPYQDRFDDSKFFGKYKYGGAEIVAYYLANDMAQKGHEIKVFTTSVDSKSSIEKCNNVEIYRYGTNLKIEKGSFSLNLFWKPLKYNVDVVHTHFTTPSADLAALSYVKMKKVPFVVTYHGDAQENYGRFIRRVAVFIHNGFLLEKVLSRADVIISPSEYYINESRFLGKYRDKIVVISNGININDFNVKLSKEECREKLELPPIDTNIILFVGNLIPYKGPEVLIKALPRIVREVPDTELVFVGSGKMRDELGKLAEKIGIKNHLKFAGFVEESMKPLYYKAADIFALPSTLNTEVFPIVLLEASAAGLPMVVSDLNTFKCIIEEGYNGLFTKRGDEKSLADAIVYLLENEDIRGKMGKNARKKVENYSWDRIAKETEKVYYEVLSS